MQDHYEKCIICTDMMERIEDADKEFLKIDASATSHYKIILNSKDNKEINNKSINNNIEGNKVSNNILLIMNPECIYIIYKIIIVINHKRNIINHVKNNIHKRTSITKVPSFMQKNIISNDKTDNNFPKTVIVIT